jgi:hypothetical protein
MLNPAGPETGSARVLRGGSWYNLIPDNCRTGGRSGSYPGNGWSDDGFRVVFAFQFTNSEKGNLSGSEQKETKKNE